MINNRQNGRRGRGRNGVRPQGSGNGGGTGRPEQGNRIDNRARGNAAQLLEKYKALARDAQMASDRVMTEYYLQFADHYFRVLADTRARMDEQRRPQGEPQGANSYQDDDYADDGEGDITDSFDDPRPDQPRYQDRGQERGQDRGQERGQDRGRDQGYNTQRSDRGGQDRQQNDGQGYQGNSQDRAPRQDRQQADGGQNGQGYQGAAQDRAPRADRADRQRREGQADGRDQRDTQRVDRADRTPRARDDGQERGNEGQGYRMIRADTAPGTSRDPADRGPVASPLAPAQPAPAMQTDDVREAPRRLRTRRPAADIPLDAAPVMPEPVAPVAEPVMPPQADPVAVEPPRRGRPRTVRPAAPVDADDRPDRLESPPAFLATPAAVEPVRGDIPTTESPQADEKPRRRRRPRAEAEDTGDVAA